MMESIYDRTVQLGEYVPEPDDDRIICRCEEVTKGEIRRITTFCKISGIRRAIL